MILAKAICCCSRKLSPLPNQPKHSLISHKHPFKRAKCPSQNANLQTIDIINQFTYYMYINYLSCPFCTLSIISATSISLKNTCLSFQPLRLFHCYRPLCPFSATTYFPSQHTLPSLSIRLVFSPLPKHFAF